MRYMRLPQEIMRISRFGRVFPALFWLAMLSAASAETRVLRLKEVHSGETLTAAFKVNGQYDRAVLKKLNTLLRDWRNDREVEMDPQLFDILWEVKERLKTDETIHVVSGHRSPETNAMLRKRSRRVARNSLHMDGRAVDFFIPGVSALDLRITGLKMERGGVGVYRGANFIHLDTGSVRHWPAMSEAQLLKVFPNGQTVHVPAGGKPLGGFDIALARLKERGGSFARSNARDDEEEDAPNLGKFLAKLFGGGKKEAPKQVPAPVIVAAPAPAPDDDEDEKTPAKPIALNNPAPQKRMVKFDAPMPTPMPKEMRVAAIPAPPNTLQAQMQALAAKNMPMPKEREVNAPLSVASIIPQATPASAPLLKQAFAPMPKEREVPVALKPSVIAALPTAPVPPTQMRAVTPPRPQPIVEGSPLFAPATHGYQLGFETKRPDPTHKFSGQAITPLAAYKFSK
jgi:uncharacterized protein YcbK (DUF882 family)